MLRLDAVVDLLNDTGYQISPFILKWRDIYYRMSLHTTGICPSFRSLRYEKSGYVLEQGLTYPISWSHQRYDWIFDTFLLNRHPRENEALRQWRKSQYKPYTQAAFAQVMDKAIGTIFADSNYSVAIGNAADNDYINGNNFHGKTLVEYVASNFQAICEDPNGFFITIPKQAGFATTTQQIEPDIYFIPTKDIILMNPDEILFNILDVSWLVNNIGYFRFKKGDDGKYIHIDAAQGGYFGHLLGRQPKEVAGGSWNTLGYYESYLKAAQAFADEFVTDKSAAQLVNKDSTHPYVTMASDDCPDCNHTGKVRYCSSCKTTANNCECDSPKVDLIACSTCSGTGQISWNPGNIKIAPPEEMDNDLIKIVNPDIKIAEFHKSNTEDCYNGIMRALHQQYIEQAQSGRAKEKDMEGQYLFLQKISHGLFCLIEKLIIDVLSLRTVSTAGGALTIAPEKYIIVQPTQFAIKTEDDLIASYEAATKADMPAFVIGRQLQEYIDKVYGGDMVMKKKVNIIGLLDPMYVLSAADKMAIVSAGGRSQRDLQLSVELPALIDNLIRAKGNEWFINAPFEAISADIVAAFALILATPLVIPTNALQIKEQ